MRKAIPLVLNGPRYPARNPNTSYRGTFRSFPGYFGDLPSDHEANALFLWFIEEGGELGVVHDEQKAGKLRDFCNSHGSGGVFELVEVTEGETAPVLTGEFLGFDLSQGFNNSLLWSGLERQLPGVPELPVRILANTVFKCFSTGLNGNGLFSSAENASQCRASLMALQALEPNLLEGDRLDKFVVVGVFSVK